MKRGIAAIVGSIVMGIALAQPAMAEGSWSSYWSYVLTGKDTRTWTDGNNDTAGTVTSFRNCHFYNYTPNTFQDIQVQLTYENTFTPDENMGQVVYNCGSSTVWQQYNYGAVKAGKYHETLIYVNGTPTPPNRLDVGTASSPGIKVSY
ncbi:MAG: hypothetical protein WCI29_02160 [Actinomycetes bacterium]